MKNSIKKVGLYVLSLVLVAAIAVGGTLAYLTSTDSDVNVLTVGNVKIEQHEYERVTDEKGNPVLGELGVDFTSNYGIEQSYKLQKFTQAKSALPAVYSNDAKETAWDEFQQLWNQVGAPGSNDLFDDSMKNVVDKFVFVENTGKTDAYYRTIVAIECPEGLSEPIHTNFNANSRFDYNDDEEGVQNSAKSNKFYTEIDGVRYLVYTATYTEILTPGEISRPSLLQVFLDPKATNEDCALFGDTWDILVVSQAVQAGGFDSASEALNEAFYKVTAEQNPWTEVPTQVSNVNDLKVALAAGKDVILDKDIETKGDTIVLSGGTKATIDLNGHSLINTVEGSPAIANYGDLTITGDEGLVANKTNSLKASHTIKNYGNLTIEGGTIGTDDTAGAAVINDGDGTVTINGGTFASKQENVKADGLCAYAFINNGTGTITINNATLNGQTHGLFGAYNGEIIVNGGNYTLDGNGGLGCYVVYATGNAKVTLNGGVINTNSPRNNRVFFVYDNGNYFNQAAVDTGKIVVKDATIYLNGVQQNYN